MKTLFAPLLTLLIATALTAQRNYSEAIALGDKAFKAENYQNAIDYYFAAEAFDPNQKQAVQQKINIVFKRITALQREAEAAKQAAIDAEQKAQKALAQLKAEQAKTLAAQANTQAALDNADSLNRKNQKLIDAFYFYDNKYTVAYKHGVYGFIDTEGDIIIDYKYEKAANFDETGYARVSSWGRSFLIDTLGNEYRVAYSPRNEYGDTILAHLGTSYMDTSILAVDLRRKHLDKFPIEIIKYRNLRVLILNGEEDSNNLNTLPSSINKLEKLESIHLKDCQLDSLPEKVFSTMILKYLDISFNPLKDVNFLQKTDLKNLLLLNMSHNYRLLNVDGLRNTNLSSLQLLDLSYNYLMKNIDGLRGIKFYKLETLYLNNNVNLANIDSLQETHFPSLKLLDISNNNLLENLNGLHGANLHRLKELNISHNDSLVNINGLSQIVSPNLEELRLSWNLCITSLSALSFMYLPELKRFSLQGNENLTDISALHTIKASAGLRINLRGCPKITEAQLQALKAAQPSFMIRSDYGDF